MPKNTLRNWTEKNIMLAKAKASVYSIPYNINASLIKNWYVPIPPGEGITIPSVPKTNTTNPTTGARLAVGANEKNMRYVIK